MKIPARLRQLTRRTLGMGAAESLDPEGLHELAAREPVIVVGIGLVRPGAIDARLPGEQRTASLVNLSSVLADVPKDRPIVLHCG
jgi:hypothetical protein